MTSPVVMAFWICSHSRATARTGVVKNVGTQYLCEQQPYYDTTDGQILWLHVICSGDHPVS